MPVIKSINCTANSKYDSMSIINYYKEHLIFMHSFKKIKIDLYISKSRMSKCQPCMLLCKLLCCDVPAYKI